MKKLTRMDKLIWTRTEPPLASGQFFGLPGGVWMQRNEQGSWASYRRQQPITFRLVAARVSLRMAPDACTAAPRAPHGWLHVQDTCRTPPLPPDVRLHDCSSCKAPQHHTHGWPHASVAYADTPRAWSIHLVLLHVKLHVQLPCTFTPHPCVDTQLLM
ncbi:hypothetical protein F2Q70_00025799 [Brassica cretica]|uniref:Uncharacterized protein n=1 Tax=Brassica cretica TaxID=69181 RepID=A0A8S9L7V7_BRACR|nr:hypothetical protein F2Q68_00025202 [Brassica cretica]KAF2601703.1 hypothetical protein F2Q70_00025799 [Brassica cretica]